MKWNACNSGSDERLDQDKSKSELINELRRARDKIFRLEEKGYSSREVDASEKYLPWHVLHNASIAYQALNAKGNLVEVNDVWLNMLGYRRSQVVGKPFQDFLSDECAAYLIDEDLSCLDFTKLNDIEVDLINKNGYPVKVTLNSYTHYDENGYILSVQCVFQKLDSQKEIKNELIDSNNKYKLMLENVYDLVWTHDMNGNYTFVSPSVQSLFGYTPEEALQRNFTDHMPEEELEIVKNYLSEIDLKSTKECQENQVYRLELRQIRKDGSMFWSEVMTSPLRDETGEIIGFQGVTRDITERKEMEQSLRRKERFLNAVLESVQDGINIIDPDFNICRANDVVRRWAGCDGSVEGMNCYEAYHNASQPCSPCLAMNCLYSGKTEYTESPGPVRSQVQWAELASHPMRDPDSGHVEYVVEFIRDVTQRKKAEEALRESERQFRQLFEQAAIGIFQSDFEHNIVKANQRACSILDYTEDELLQMNAEQIIHPEDLREKPLQENLNKLLSGETLEIERRFRKRNGIYIHVLVNLGMLSCQENKVSHMVMFQDISHRKDMENRLVDMSIREPLTDVYNRAFFEDQMRRLEDEPSFPLGLVACDINGLKLINDTMGHAQGDEMVRAVARLLKRCFRKSDLIARVGGDEFAVILPGTDEETLQSCCARLRSEVARYNSMSHERGLSLSIGYALEHAPPVDMHDLFKRADNAMYKEKLQQSYSSRSETVQALIKTLEARDHITDGHADRLARYALQLGRSMGLTEERLNDLQLLARFHDLGKVGISDRILVKQGALTEEEYQEMKRHCEIGYRIALSTSDLAPIASYILKHHERWDGLGYPQGLAGKEIPLECRILAIADAYDAMINERPYSRAKPRSEAIGELKRCAGSQFDPELVDQFLLLLESPPGS